MAKSENQKKKKKGKINKLIKGLIIGGAIGSVVGITLAPKSGSETRKFIGTKSQEVFDKMKNIATSGKGTKHVCSFAKGLKAMIFGKKK